MKLQTALAISLIFAIIADKTLQINGTNLNPIHLYMPQFTNNNLQFKPTLLEEFMKAIGSLTPKTSSGIVEISARLTKICKTELTGPLTNIINKSLQQGTFPSLLKTSKVYPKYKKDPQLTWQLQTNLTGSNFP